MSIVLPVYRSGAQAKYKRNQERIRAWILAQDRPVTVQDALEQLGGDRTTLINHLNRLANRGEIASAKVKAKQGKRGPRWRYYGRPEVLAGLPGWKRRGLPCEEGYKEETLQGPEGLMWRVLDEALRDAARAREPEEQEEIWSWFAEPDPNWLFSCASICDVLDLDQWAILETLREGKARETLRRIQEIRRGGRR